MKVTLFIGFFAPLVAVAAPQDANVGTSDKLSRPKPDNSHNKDACAGIIGFSKVSFTGKKPHDHPLPKDKRVDPDICEVICAQQGCKSGLGNNCQTIICDLYDGSCGFSGTKFDDAVKPDADSGDYKFYKPTCTFTPPKGGCADYC
ncbi:hypothetical protein IWZ01DRAFT_486786 [Phyllosticta capitalensis]